MLTNWIIFGASALAILVIANKVNTALTIIRVSKRMHEHPEEDLNDELMERNNRMMEEARKKGLAA